jgi:DNA-binding CsgD family transcriptional regulator
METDGVSALSTVDVDRVLMLLEHRDIDRAIDRLHSIRDTLASRGAPGAKRRTVRGGVTLTPRERQVLEFLSDGAMSQKDVARLLGVTTNTVKTHLKAAYLKLGAHSRSEAVRLARQCDLFGSSTLHVVPIADYPNERRPSRLTRNGADATALRSA